MLLVFAVNRPAAGATREELATAYHDLEVAFEARLGSGDPVDQDILREVDGLYDRSFLLWLRARDDELLERIGRATGKLGGRLAPARAPEAPPADLEARLAGARRRVAAIAADDPRKPSLEWAIHRLERGEAGSQSPAIAPALPIRYEAELAALDRDEPVRAGRPGAGPPSSLRGDTLQAFRGPRGELVPFRLYIPERWDGRSPLPLVIALHGASANEHTYFDLYGAGKVKRLAEARGYAVAAPRLGDHGFGGILPDPAGPGAVPIALLEHLERLVPVDRRRVFLTGHSMGGMMALETAAAHPGRFRAVGAVAGPRDVDVPRLARTPVFLAVGARDGMAPGVRALARELEPLQPGLEMLELDDVGHVLAVSLSMERVFEFFDRHGAAPIF